MSTLSLTSGERISMSYNRKMDLRRTARINEVFRCIADQQKVLTNANTQTIDLTLEIPIGAAG